MIGFNRTEGRCSSPYSPALTVAERVEPPAPAAPLPLPPLLLSLSLSLLSLLPLPSPPLPPPPAPVFPFVLAPLGRSLCHGSVAVGDAADSSSTTGSPPALKADARRARASVTRIVTGVAETTCAVSRPLPALTVPDVGRRGRGETGWLMKAGVEDTTQVDVRGEPGPLRHRDEREDTYWWWVGSAVTAEVGDCP